MNIGELAHEIINGRRLTRKDDLSFFAEAELEELCGGAAGAARAAAFVPRVLTFKQRSENMVFFQSDRIGNYFVPAELCAQTCAQLFFSFGQTDFKSAFGF